MARIVDFDIKDQPRAGRRPQYPWEEWFDGKNRVLVQGEDYESERTPGSFRSTVYSAARRYGVPIAAKIIKGELHVQAIEPMKPRKTNGDKKKVIRRTKS